MKRFSLLLIILFPILLSAQFIQREKAIKILEEVKSEEYPNSNEIFVTNDITNLNKNCTGTDTIEEYKKVLNENAKRNNSIYFYYDSNYSTLSVKTIQIIKKDGKVINFDPKTVLKEKIYNSGASNIYSYSTKILTTTLPDLEIGDIVYTKSIRNMIKARMENNFFTEISIQSYRKYLYNYEKIIVPKTINLNIHELNKSDFPYEFSKNVKNGKTIYEWTIKDNPIIIHEPNMEDANMFAHRIMVTTLDSWEQASRWYYNLVEPHMKINKDIKDKVSELISGVKGRKERAAKIYYWVAKNIRYLGVDKEKNRPGYEPHDVIYTFESRGGVCRDKAALLAAMLREGGFNANVILISSGSRLDPRAPVVWFNHAITAMYDEKGNTEFIFDPTDENTKDFLPKYEEDSSYLIASKKGTTLRVAPISNPKLNNATVNINLNLDKDMNATGSMNYHFSGFSDTIFRNIFARFTRQDYEKFFSRLASGLNPNAVMESFDFAKPQNKDENMFCNLKIKIPHYGTDSENYVFIPFDASKLNLHFLYGYVMRPFSLTNRKYNFKMAGAFSFDINLEIHFAENMKNVSIPKLENIDYKGFKVTLDSKITDNSLKCNYHFENSKVHFKQADFIPLKAKLAKLTQYENLYIIGDKEK